MREADDTPGSFHRAEDGMITVSAVVAVFGFAVLAALVGSVGAAVNRKVEAQNAADAVALSCSVQRARTLNAVTAVNHLTGELLAAVVLQEALGGLKPGDGRPRDTTAEDTDLERAKREHDIGAAVAEGLAPGFKAETPAYRDVIGRVDADYALLDAHRELKVNLTRIYRVKIVLLAVVSLYPVPFGVGPAVSGVGQFLYAMTTLVERFLDEAEWALLDKIKGFAETTGGVRDLLIDAAPNPRGMAKELVEGPPDLLDRTAEAVARRNAATAGAVYPSRPGPAVAPEDVPLDAPAPRSRLFFPANDPPPESRKPGHWGDPPAFARAQVVRAAYPWVNYHRQPVLELTRWMVFSDFPKHYRNWTTEVALFRCGEHYRRADTRLYTLTGLDRARKAKAPWLDDTRAAEEAFAAVGFARRGAPDRWATRFLPPTNPGGSVAFAQGLLYNANARRPAPDDPVFQPVTGWDTLNWDTGAGDPAHAAAVEWPKFRRTHGPRVKLNWQAKLVPVSRLGEAAPRVGGGFGEVLGRLDPDSPLAHGH